MPSLMEYWETVPPAQRAAHLAGLPDATVLRMAKSRAKQRKTTPQRILAAWVVNGYIPRMRARRIEAQL